MTGPRHCADCDRPSLCDRIAPKTAPCGQNAGCDRETTLALRIAFTNGAGWERSAAAGFAQHNGDALVEARRRYPLPKVRRDRVVRDPHDQDGDYEYTVKHGEIVLLYKGSPINWEFKWPTPERVALWADLFARPTEEVEAES